MLRTVPSNSNPSFASPMTRSRLPPSCSSTPLPTSPMSPIAASALTTSSSFALGLLTTPRPRRHLGHRGDHGHCHGALLRPPPPHEPPQPLLHLWRPHLRPLAGQRHHRRGLGVRRLGRYSICGVSRVSRGWWRRGWESHCRRIWWRTRQRRCGEGEGGCVAKNRLVERWLRRLLASAKEEGEEEGERETREKGKNFLTWEGKDLSLFITSYYLNHRMRLTHVAIKYKKMSIM